MRSKIHIVPGTRVRRAWDLLLHFSGNPSVSISFLIILSTKLWFQDFLMAPFFFGYNAFQGEKLSVVL